MVHAYTFDNKNEFSKKGISVVCNYLKTLKETTTVENVEDEQKFQTLDVDLIWVYKKDKDEIKSYIEVKTDKYTTGNFWLETLSNESLKTAGCFVKSKADYFFYYFTEWDRLYIIPMQKAQAWFITNMQRFRESKTTTKDANGNYQHTTVGRLVPIEIMLKEVRDIKIVENVSKNSS